MLWTIDLACAVILMSLTGSICLFIWALLGWILERVGFMDIMYDILQMTVLFFVVPIIWPILKIHSNEIGRVFLQTEQILTFSKGVLRYQADRQKTDLIFRRNWRKMEIR